MVHCFKCSNCIENFVNGMCVLFYCLEVVLFHYSLALGVKIIKPSSKLGTVSCILLVNAIRDRETLTSKISRATMEL